MLRTKDKTTENVRTKKWGQDPSDRSGRDQRWQCSVIVAFGHTGEEGSSVQPLEKHAIHVKSPNPLRGIEILHQKGGGRDSVGKE